MDGWMLPIYHPFTLLVMTHTVDVALVTLFFISVWYWNQFADRSRVNREVQKVNVTEDNQSSAIQIFIIIIAVIFRIK